MNWKFLLSIAFSTLFSLHIFGQSNTFNLTVKEDRTDCQGVGVQKCYLVKYSNSKDWEYFYAPLTNFKYEDGYQYRLQVKRTRLVNPPPNAPSYTYSVIRVLQKKHMTESSKNQSEQISMLIKENKVDCTGVGHMKCFLVKFTNSKDWEYFYSNIKNFDYEEGYRYQLLVKRTKVAPVPADASSLSYELVKVVSKTRIDTPDERQMIFLSKHRWKLLQLYGENQSNSDAYMDFDWRQKRITGNGSCNGYFGNVVIGQRNIAFTSIGATQKACLNNNVETEFFKLLALNDLTYDLADQTFNLYHNNKLVAIFGLAEKPTK